MFDGDTWIHQPTGEEYIMLDGQLWRKKMSLLEDIKSHYESSAYLPDEELISEKVIDSLRWGNLTEFVFKRGDEYVMVSDVEPATEMQGWGDYGAPAIKAVKPVEKTIVVTTWEEV